MANSRNTSGTADPGYVAGGAKDGILERLRRVEGVDEHARHCVLGAAPENQDEMRAELMTALTRLVGRR